MLEVVKGCTHHWPQTFSILEPACFVMGFQLADADVTPLHEPNCDYFKLFCL